MTEQYEQEIEEDFLKVNKRITINKKIIQKAYFLDENLYKDMKNEQQDLQINHKVPEDFYKLLGKILTFVEQADKDQL